MKETLFIQFAYFLLEQFDRWRFSGQESSYCIVGASLLSCIQSKIWCLKLFAILLITIKIFQASSGQYTIHVIVCLFCRLWLF